MIERRFKPGDRVMYFGSARELAGLAGTIVRVEGARVIVDCGVRGRRLQAFRADEIARIDQRSRS